MRDPTINLMSAIDRDLGGVAVVWCPDFGLRDWLLDEVEALVPTAASAFRCTDLDSAIAQPDRMALLAPMDEAETVLDLNGRRDELLAGPTERSQPIVLFLLDNGPGQRAFATEAPSLWSWISGSDADPEALSAIDVSAERARFEAEHGQLPEAWLDAWAAGAIDRDARTLTITYDAKLLASR